MAGSSMAAIAVVNVKERRYPPLNQGIGKPVSRSVVASIY